MVYKGNKWSTISKNPQNTESGWYFVVQKILAKGMNKGNLMIQSELSRSDMDSEV